MVINDKMLLRELARRKWIEPSLGLRRLQSLSLFSKILSELGREPDWRSNRFRKYWEEYQAALFTYGLSQQTPKLKWEYSYGELRDFEDGDCFVRTHESVESIKPVQLKELVPFGEGSQNLLQKLLDDMAKKFTDPPGQEVLVVAIFVNRTSSLCFRTLKIPALRVQQLWFYGFRDETNCFLVGGKLHAFPKTYSFTYPLS